MKKIYSFLLAAVALLSLVSIAQADGDTTTPQKGPDYYLNDPDPEKASLGYMKSISEPNTDGVYTITLESFATGQSVKLHKSIPADIVLVLDVSGSMEEQMGGGDNTQRLVAMKNAVNAFIDIIDENDRVDPSTKKTRAQRLGNQIAIVAFSGPANAQQTTPTAANSIKLNTGWRTLGDDRDVDNYAGYNYLKNTAVQGLTATGGTFSNFGMQAAYNLVSNLPDDHKLRTVVFFTDGDPGRGNYWTSTQRVNNRTVLTNNYGRYTWQAANESIRYSNLIKQLGANDDELFSKVYSISIITNPSSYTNVYLDQISSNYSGADEMAELLTYSYRGTTYYYINNWNFTGNWTARTGSKVADTFSFAPTDTEELKSVFEDIAEDSGGGSEDLGEQAVTEIDVVSASFTLPADLSDMTQAELEAWIKANVNVYTAPCTGMQDPKEYIDDEGETQTGTFLAFGGRTKAPNSTETYDKIVIVDGEKTIVPTDIDNAIVVTVSASDPAKPDKMDKIEVKYFDYGGNWCGPRYDDDGTTILGWHGHKVIVEIPIMMDKDAVGGADVATNGQGSGIWVNGLNAAPFKSPQVSLPINLHIRKEGLQVGESSKFLIERKLKTGTTWTEVSSVFVTRTENDAEDGDNAPIVKVLGLPSVDENDNEFVYRVIESNWSWSYNLVSIQDAAGHTIGNVTSRSATSDELITNPFVFVNEKKDAIEYNVRHAESKATNTFKTGVEVKYDDSKTNTRE